MSWASMDKEFIFVWLFEIYPVFMCGLSALVHEFVVWQLDHTVFSNLIFITYRAWRLHLVVSNLWQYIWI